MFIQTGALLIIVTTCFIRRKPETVYVNNPKDVEMPIKADMMFARAAGTDLLGACTCHVACPDPSLEHACDALNAALVRFLNDIRKTA